ncbi:ribosomal-protein-alanine N-acetyltransferase [Rhodothalassium salexigens DSM 2132]|uniref:Ribosomal-protein-alanine N-acetyltransferase n=1 Tax=Rhodothalassium salexigens DSM 2132 TaxID=1188247 RepID=A0A4R2PKY4_RHOSA|nr:GNAT family N-acetyltransferase [Rhodothalassium salexigens]MBB4211092.1 ribosomal-protein-alanine N-acetyltransferase [Rhodothalassium salexigens DSM 2132]MBK1640000.1 hypothetical protein [Rhodothalassium salexigens DSM 2132]TCP36252.1 ribosomal-protein-alanine N-acetyltransferase [Rhodothalassium salexigens DSM 2132]
MTDGRPEPAAADRQPPTVRPVRATDAESLHAVHAQCFDPRSGEFWRRSDLVAALDQPTMTALVAETPAGVTMGYALARRAADQAEILSLGVAPDNRRSGCARHLLRQMVKRLKRQGVSHVFLEVRETNVAARALYEAAGFRVIGRRRAYYLSHDGTRTDGLTMMVNTSRDLFNGTA